jgi:hypothetical protein
MKYAIKADAAGTMVEIVEFDESNSYETIKEATGGGWIDCVRIPMLGVDVWIDDEGKLTDSPNLNAFGTALWFMQYGMNDYISGDIIVTGGVDAKGNTLGMNKEKAIQVIREVMKMTDQVLSDVETVSEQMIEHWDDPAFKIINLDE